MKEIFLKLIFNSLECVHRLAITSEHKRLLTALDPHERHDAESYLADEHSTSKLKRRRKFIHPLAGVTCLVAVVTLIVVIVYSHLILNAVHTNANFGSLNINNISQRLDWLNDELHQIANNASRDNRNLRLSLDSMGKSLGNGIKTPDILKRLDDVTHRVDQLLLEQIQTDRRINLKLEVLENSVNILKSQLEADRMSRSQINSDDGKQSQLEAQNRQIEAKLTHLKAILDRNANLPPEELRKEIENDSQLAPEESKSVWDEAVDHWNKLVHSDSSRSSSNDRCSVGIRLIVASVFLALLFQNS